MNAKESMDSTNSSDSIQSIFSVLSIFSKIRLFALCCLLPLPTLAQTYIGFVYPAGGQQGTTFRCTLGGQALDGVCGVIVTGDGVTGRIAEYNKRLNPQEMQLLREQLRELKAVPEPERSAIETNMMARIEKLINDYVSQPQCDSIANLVVIEVTVAPDALPGAREIRLVTERGISNPMPFHIGQLPEVTGEPLASSHKQILGKEAQSLRRRKPRPGALNDIDDDVVRLTLPCVANGQIASGSVDRYRFAARRGQRLTITTQARSLVPFLADAVPGWFQPVLALYDAQGNEVAYNDDYRFKPDPVIIFDVPHNGDYTLAIHDALFRGREDFVYRVTLGGLPFVTSVSPLGCQTGTTATVSVQGINLAETQLTLPPQSVPGIYPLTARDKDGFLSPSFPFAVDTLPSEFEREPNDTPKLAQRITLPLAVNGVISAPGDRDLFLIQGRAGQEIAAEIFARRLDSPLDATLTLFDSRGTRIAFNDDREDVATDLNTHHADAYIRAMLPVDGTYTLAVSDAQRNGGDAYAYRLRVEAPLPDFELRVVPSRVAMVSNGVATVSVHVLRRDGINVPVRFRLRDPAINGFTLLGGGTVAGTQTVTRLTLKTSLSSTPAPVPVVIQGVTTYAGQEVVRDAIPAEDRTQAFFWRHLVPAQEFLVLVYPPAK